MNSAAANRLGASLNLRGNQSDARLGIALGSRALALAWGLCILMGMGEWRSWAHGDTHGMIIAVTQELQQRPNDPELYYRRGELYRRHGLFDLAWTDLETAQRLGTNRIMIDFSRGLLLSEAKWPVSAKLYLDRFLAAEPKHVPALAARARVFLQLTNREAAVKDLTSAIQNLTDPQPDLYVERAQVQSEAGDAGLKEALRGLDEGLKRLGSVITLELYSLDLELKLSQTNAALARLDRIIAQSPRKEAWCAKKGDILQNAGRWDEAKASFAEAIRHLEKLPASRRNVPALQELANRIRTAQAEVETHLKSK